MSLRMTALPLWGIVLGIKLINFQISTWGSFFIHLKPLIHFVPPILLQIQFLFNKREVLQTRPEEGSCSWASWPWAKCPSPACVLGKASLFMRPTTNGPHPCGMLDHQYTTGNSVRRFSKSMTGARICGWVNVRLLQHRKLTTRTLFYCSNWTLSTAKNSEKFIKLECHCVPKTFSSKLSVNK